MGRFINPFTDVGFKRIFGQEVNKPLLISFLNSLFAGKKVITDIHFLNKEMLGINVEDRNSIYDVYCTSDTGEHFIVEMQNRNHKNFKNRAVYYVSKAITWQGERGPEWVFDLKVVYGIFFMNFRQKGWEDKLRLEGLVIDPDSHKVLLDTTHYIFLQLPAFQKEESECETDFERWIYVLKNMDTLDRLPFKARMAVFKRLEDIVEIAALSKEDRLRYEESVKVHRDNLAVEAYALETGWEKGHEEGWNEGHKEGWNLGLEVGKAEGIKEGHKAGEQIGLEKGLMEGKREVARNLKQQGLPIQTIAICSGLTEEEIRLL